MKGLSRIIPVFAFLIIPIAVCAQQASFAGKYEGTAKEAARRRSRVFKFD
jgi:hypothetical protein